MIPKHIAIIMDGNGRWAKEKGLQRTKGHEAGSKTLREIVEYAFNNKIEVLSVFAFSCDNFKRKKTEVNYLMSLFSRMFTTYFDELNDNGIKIVFSKKSSGLPKKLESIISKVESNTKENKKGILNICINYTGQDEIVDTVKNISLEVKNNEIKESDITKEFFETKLYQNLPPIDLLIRTSGEYRVSNFMMWQMSYSEFYFTKTYFPDFNKDEFKKALLEYEKRNRKFGKEE